MGQQHTHTHTHALVRTTHMLMSNVSVCGRWFEYLDEAFKSVLLEEEEEEEEAVAACSSLSGLGSHGSSDGVELRKKKLKAETRSFLTVLSSLSIPVQTSLCGSRRAEPAIF